MSVGQGKRGRKGREWVDKRGNRKTADETFIIIGGIQLRIPNLVQI